MKRKVDRSRKGSKPLLPLISRRKFMIAGAIGAATVTISPLGNTFIVHGADPSLKVKWGTVLGFVDLSLVIMGYGPIAGLISELIAAIKAKDPAQAMSIVGETKLLKGKKYLDPANFSGVDVALKAFKSEDGKLGIPFLHSDGLNLVTSLFSGNSVLARLAGSTHGAVPGATAALTETYGFDQKNVGGILAPVKQIVTSFGKLDVTDKVGDRYTSQAGADVRFFNTSLGRGRSENNVVIANVEDPTTRKKVHIEDRVKINYEP